MKATELQKIIIDGLKHYRNQVEMKIREDDDISLAHILMYTLETSKVVQIEEGE